MENLTMKQWRLLKEFSVAEMSRRLDLNVQTYKKYEENPELVPLGKALLFCNIVGAKFDKVFLLPDTQQNVAQ